MRRESCAPPEHMLITALLEYKSIGVSVPRRMLSRYESRHMQDSRSSRTRCIPDVYKCMKFGPAADAAHFKATTGRVCGRGA